jgi:ribose transport system permease protein
MSGNRANSPQSSQDETTAVVGSGSPSQQAVTLPARGSPRVRLRGALGWVPGTNSLVVLAILAVIGVAFSLAAPGHFDTVDNFRFITIDSAVLLLLATGQTFVIITAGIDLSVGSVLVFSGIVGAEVMLALGGQVSANGLPQPVSSAGTEAILVGLAASLASGLGWGLLNGVLIAKGKIPPLIVTLGSFGAALGLAQIITGGVDVVGISPALTTTVGTGSLYGLPWLVVISTLVVVGAALLLYTTRFGRHTFAVGSNAEAARRAGINVDRHLILVYALAGTLSGLAGYLSLARFATTTLAGHSSDNMNAIAAVVIGGTSLFGGVGSLFGTVIGVLIPTTLLNGFTVIGVQPFWESVAVAIVLVLAVYIDQLRRRRARHQ